MPLGRSRGKKAEAWRRPEPSLPSSLLKSASPAISRRKSHLHLLYSQEAETRPVFTIPLDPLAGVQCSSHAGQVWAISIICLLVLFVCSMGGGGEAAWKQSKGLLTFHS